MEFEKLLEARRSIRAYKSGEKIEKADIEAMLKAAQQAPSWKNSQTGRYYAVISENKLAEIREKCLPAFNQNNSANALALIVTAFVKKRAGFETDGTPTNELGDEWGAYDLGLQNQNLILKATELGYDSLIMGIRDEKVLREELNIPDEQEVVAVIAIGKREKEAQAPKRKEIEEIATFF